MIDDAIAGLERSSDNGYLATTKDEQAIQAQLLTARAMAEVNQGLLDLARTTDEILELLSSAFRVGWGDLPEDD